MENGETKKPIRSFQDLEVYQNLYKAMVTVLTRIVPSLPREERYDLGDQMRRACKAPPALLAEGFAKRYQKRNWRKYLEDAIGECSEMINHLSVCRDVYARHVSQDVCQDMILVYDIASKQLYRLKERWQNFHDNA